MSLTTKNQLLIAFKKLVGKSHTNSQFGSANESIGSNVQIDNATIFSQPIPSSPSSSLYSITNNIVEKVQFSLVSIPSSQYTAVGAAGGGITTDGDGAPSQGTFTNGIHAYALVLPSNYQTLSSNPKKGTGVFINNQSLTASNGLLQIVPERYGALYPASVSSSTGIIAPLEEEDYLLDPYSGILFLQDINRVPTSVTAYVYIGDYLTERVSSSLGQFTTLSGSSLNITSISGTTAEFTTITGTNIASTNFNNSFYAGFGTSSLAPYRMIVKNGSLGGANAIRVEQSNNSIGMDIGIDIANSGKIAASRDLILQGGPNYGLMITSSREVDIYAGGGGSSLGRIQLLQEGVVVAGVPYNDYDFVISGTVGSTTQGRLRFANLGTSSAPLITQLNDTDTGIYFPDADTIAFSTNGTERLRITGSGDTIVSGNLTVTGSTTLSTVSGTTAQFNIVTGSILRTNGIGVGTDYQTNGANVAAFSAEDPNITINMGASASTVGTIKWYQGSAHKMTLGYQGAGTEGVGFGIPNTETNEGLNIYSPLAIRLINGFSGASNRGLILNFSASLTGTNITFRSTTNTDSFYLDHTKMNYIGNLRLGSSITDVPAAKLDVSGSVIVTGSLTASADIIVNGATVGRGAGVSPATSSLNLAFGTSALALNTSGTANIALGNSALSANTTGFSNLAIGPGANAANQTGNRNIAIGDRALNKNTASDNIVIGVAGGFNVTTGARNVAIGANVIDSTSVGNDNVALGYRAMQNNTSGSNNVAVGSSALISNILGSSNVAIGQEALKVNTVSENTAIGTLSLFSNTTGVRNTAIGMEALYSNVVGTSNTAVGHNALYSNTGERNTAVGRAALASNTIGATNVAVGELALNLNTIGSNNIAVGVNSLSANISGSNNVAIGTEALRYQSGNIASKNTAIGSLAMQASRIGEENVAHGYLALQNMTSGSRNVALGTQAGVNLSADAANSSNNVFIGAAAGASLISGSKNILIGQGVANTNVLSGSGNIFIGNELNTVAFNGLNNTVILAPNGTERLRIDSNGNLGLGKTDPNTRLDVNGNTIVSGNLTVTGSTTLSTISGTTAQFTTITSSGDVLANSIIIGTSAGNISTNTVLGRNALTSNTTGFLNVAIGFDTLANNSVGHSNVAIGYQTLDANTSGTYNVAVGRAALGSNTTGEDNVAIGMYSMLSNISGNFNVAVGRASLQSNIGGVSNVAIGYGSLQNNIGNYNTSIGRNNLNSNTIGEFNSAHGYTSLSNNVSGNNNSAFGYSSLRLNVNSDNSAFGKESLESLTNGSNNTALGSAAGQSIQTGSYNLFLGCLAGAGETSLSNTVIIRAGALAADERIRINSSGNVGIAKTTPNARLDVNGNTIISGNLTVTGSITELSTRRIKTNIESMTNQLYTVNQLNPVSYVRLDDNRKEYGFISEEVREVYPEFVVGEGINYPKMVSVLVSAVKELTQKIEKQQVEIEELKTKTNI